MSDMLTPEAPEPEVAATAPAPEPAAEVGSVDSAEVIPKERFNGLMSRYNADKASWEAEREAMRTEVERLSQAGQESDVSDEVLDEIRALRQELANEKLGNARERALAKYPGAKPLADLIVGNTPEDIEAMAAEIESRLSGLTAAPEGTPPAGAPENANGAPAGAPEVPQVGGAAAFDAQDSADDAVQAALDAGDFVGYFRAAEQRALQGGADLTVG